MSIGIVVAVAVVFVVKDQAAPRLETAIDLTGNTNTTPDPIRPPQNLEQTAEPEQTQETEETTPPEATNGEPFNILVMGVDEKPPRLKTEDNGGSRSDTLMLARVEPETGDIAMVSIPRDLWVETSPGTEGKINSAYTEGGPELVVDVVENYTQASVDHTVIVDFKGFKEVIDALGGLKMEVEEGLPANHGLQSGIQTLNGRQALFYSRYRGSAGGDFDRMDRQRKVVAALRSQMLQLSTITKLPGIVKALDENIQSDLDFDETLALGKALLQRGQGTQLRSTKLEGEPETLPDGEQVVVPDAAANEQILQDFR